MHRSEQSAGRGRVARHFKLALMASVFSTLAGSAAFAQASPPAPTAAPTADQSQTVQEIVVTGSRIRGVAPVGSPIIGVSHEEIAQQGVTTLTGALQQVPQVFNFGITPSSRGTSGGAGNITYASGIDIRGLGPYATLTLLDGRRIVQAGTVSGLPDPSDIPLLALERVEIVADGASAIYGSDAVAGVANIILRRNVEGFETMGRYQFADDYSEWQAGLRYGHRWSSGQIMMAYEHDYNSPLNGADRSYYQGNQTAAGGKDYRIAQCSPANIVIKGVSYAMPAMQPGTTNLCDNLKVADLLPLTIRDNFAMTFNQDITDRISVFSDVTVSQRLFQDHKGLTASTVTVPSTNAFYTLPPGVAASTETVNTAWNYQAPQNNSTGKDTAYQITGGVDVKLPHDFKFEGDYTYGQDVAYSISTAGVNNAALSPALASSNPATAINPYGPSNPAVISSVFSALMIAPGNKVHQDGELKLDGPLFHLPGGDVRIAVGGEYDDEWVSTGLTSGTLAAPVASRVYPSQIVWSGYGELLVPIVGSENAMPGVRLLTLDVAGRYDDYLKIGNTANPKIGLNWSPVDDLKLHASYGTSFRAPLPTQVLGASNALYVQNYTTPNGIVQGVTLSGYKTGNPLVPETATTYSFGADYRPSSIPGLDLSLNYFNIDYRNQITSYLSNLSILSTPALQQQFASLIVSNPAQAQAIVNGLIAQHYVVNGVLPNPVSLFVYGQNFNLGHTETDGLDFSGTYRRSTDYGTFGAGLQGVAFFNYRVAVTPTAPLLPQLNHLNNPLALRMRGTLSWEYGPFRATSYVNWENGYLNDTVTPAQNVSDYTTVDLHLAYALDGLIKTDWIKNTNVTLDFTNLFDARPPYVNIAESPNGGGGFDPTQASPIGRMIGVSIDKRW